jgi:hypothetical protein
VACVSKEDRGHGEERIKSRMKEGKGEGLGAARESPDVWDTQRVANA